MQSKPELVFEDVYGRLSEARKEEIFRMWSAHTSLSAAEQRKRIEQVVYLILYAEAVAGVTTAYRMFFSEEGSSYYVYRMFIAPGIRGKIGMRLPEIVEATCERLRSENEGAKGMLVVTENRKLMQPGIRKLFRRHGYRYLGEAPGGQEIWCHCF